VHASVARKPEARLTTAAPPAFAGSFDLPTRQSGAFHLSPLTVSEFGEHALIARITARLTRPSWVVVGPGDDAAVIEPERGSLDVLTTDAQVEGVHFDRRFVPPDAIGHRALAVNLSDLAAMGACPRAALLSLMLPGDFPMEAVDGILDGLLTLADRHRVTVVVGNVTRSPGPVIVDVTAIGAVRPRRVLTRAGARPGDEVYVTGQIGGAAVGLRQLQATVGGPSGVATDLQVCRYLRPEPRVRAGLLLGRNRVASACMDLSDGLADGLRQVAAASGVGIAIDATALPVDENVREYHQARGLDSVEGVLAGGDDYELIFTIRPAHRRRLRAVTRLMGDLPITKVGTVTRDRRVVVRTPQGDRDLPAGFEHFR